MLSGIKTFFNLLLTPLHIVYTYTIKRIFIYFSRDVISFHESLHTQNLEENKKLRDKNDKLSEKLNRLKKILSSNQNTPFEASKTKYGETVLIKEAEKMETYVLYGMNGKNKHRTSPDCHISLRRHFDFSQDQSEKIYLIDIRANTKRQGYARALLNFIIDKAKKSGAQEIYGNLSLVDKGKIAWLVPFYESLGFQCTLYEEATGSYIGKISAVLIETPSL